MKKQYSKFLVGSDEVFDPANFSSLPEEISIIREETSSLTGPHKPEMIISYLKNHSLQQEWISANPELKEWVIANAGKLGTIESLFESSRKNSAFSRSLENYLTENIRPKAESPLFT